MDAHEHGHLGAGKRGWGKAMACADVRGCIDHTPVLRGNYTVNGTTDDGKRQRTWFRRLACTAAPAHLGAHLAVSGHTHTHTHTHKILARDRGALDADANSREILKVTETSGMDFTVVASGMVTYAMQIK